MKLVIDKNTYSFKFGTKFIRELDKRYPLQHEGVTFGMGLSAKVLPELIGFNTATLASVLSIANATEEERITLDQLDDYIDSVEDIESLFNEVRKEISESNAGKLASRSFDERLNKK